MKFRFPHRFVFLSLLILVAAGMLGCGAGSNLLGKPSTSTATAAAPTAPSGSSAPAPAPAPVPAPTIQLAANPTSITAGQNSVLTWTSTNATSVSIQPGSSNLAVSGSVTVTPTATTTYTATASGAGGMATASVAVTVASAPAMGYAFGHVAIVALENKNYSEVVGNTSAMPYLNSLINQYASATNYYADTHPSIGNYFMLTTGQILTNDDSYTGTVTADNVVREMLAAGKTFKSYAEDLPYAGYVGGDTGLYIARHNPFTFFSDIRNNSTLAASTILPFSQFASDMAAGQLPQYSFIVPNMNDDAHECPNGINACLATADAWLKQNIAPLLADANFQKDGVLIVWFDEADTDNTNGGGQVPLVMISPAWCKMGYQSSTFYQHENALRFTMDALGVTTVPGAGAMAKGMNEFFNAH